MASRNRKWNEWERTEFTTRGSDPTVVVIWSYRYKDGNGATRTVSIEEFQGVYSFEVDGERVPAPAHRQWELLHKSMEEKFQAEVDAAYELRHGSECEHGYWMGRGCKGCDPDGI